MKNKFLKAILSLMLVSTVFVGCVNDDDYSVPQIECNETNAKANLTIAQLKAAVTPTATLYTASDTIEARIVSSDKGGNFYKLIYMNSLDGSIGFSVAVNQTSNYEQYNVGRKVYVSLKGLYVQLRSNTIQIGALYNGNVGQIAATDVRKHIIRSCDVVEESTLVQEMKLADAINNDNIGKLIELTGLETGVQFVDAALGQTYYNASNVVGSETNHLITDPSNPAEPTLIFRTGSFAEYAGTPVSPNSGKIRGILTKFNNDFQFVSRYETDLQLTEERIGEIPPVEPGEPGEPSGTAVGGTDIQFLGAVTENFESYSVSNTVFPKYVNDYVANERYWQVKQFPSGTGNKYIEMTAFSGSSNPGVAGKTYLFVPVNFTAANSFSFSKEFRYMAGAALKIYYVTADNYTAGNTVNTSTLVDITSSFTGLTYPANGQSQNAFTTAGSYSIPASLTGNGFFVFEYTGSETVTTTVQLDDIVIN